MSEKQVPISIYAESTPNPATMKFVASSVLVPNGTSAEYTSAQEASDSP